MDSLDNIIAILNSGAYQGPPKPKQTQKLPSVNKTLSRISRLEEALSKKDTIEQQNLQSKGPSTNGGSFQEGYLGDNDEDDVKTQKNFYKSKSIVSSGSNRRVYKNPSKNHNQMGSSQIKYRKPPSTKQVLEQKRPEKQTKASNSSRTINFKSKKFNIRKINSNTKKKHRNRPLNLITVKPSINTKIEIVPVGRTALNNNRLAKSKHVLIKTMNRYMSNPSMFQKNLGGMSDLVSLNQNFSDPQLVSNLFRSGTASFSKTLDNRRCLVFRPFVGNPREPIEEQEDLGYNFKMPNSSSNIVKKTLSDNGFNLTNSKYNWLVMWQVGKVAPDILMKLKPSQKVNYIPAMKEITRKDKMNRNVSQMVIKHGKEFDFVPKTYLLPQELALLIRDHDQQKSKNKYYIVKPTGSSQGRGIFVTNNIQKV